MPFCLYQTSHQTNTLLRKLALTPFPQNYGELWVQTQQDQIHTIPMIINLAKSNFPISNQQHRPNSFISSSQAPIITHPLIQNMINGDKDQSSHDRQQGNFNNDEEIQL